MTTRRRPHGHAPSGGPLSADCLSILDALDLPIVLVRGDFTIVRFNRAATAALGLTLSNIGRSARHIGVLTDVVDVEERCAQVIADGVSRSCHVRNGDARFLLRMASYGTGDPQIEGAVLTFTNVSALQASIEQAIHEREYTKTILNTVSEPLVVLDAELRVQTGNRAFHAMFQVSRDDAQGVRLCDLGSPDWDIPRLQTLLNTCFTDGEPAALEIEHDFPVLGPRTVLLNARRLFSEGARHLVLLAIQDVTARKRAEAELRRTKENLSDFVENAMIAMHWVGPDGMILWANRTELETLGYAREEYVGHHIAEFHADAPVIEDILERLTRGEALREYPAQLRGKDGSIRHVLISSNVLWEDGKFVHTRCFTRDITERKRDQEALRLRGEQFESLLNQAPLGVYLVDADFRIREVNPIALAVFGDISGGVVGRDFDEIIHILWEKKYADEMVRIFRHTLETGEPYITPERAEFRIDRGVTEYYEWRLDRITLPDGGYGLVCYFRDISEQVQARLTIAKSEERFRSLVSVITDVPWTADAQGRFVEPQLAWSRYTGQTWEELRGFGRLNALHPEDRPKAQETWQRARKDRALYKVDGRLWHAASRQYRHVVARATPLINADGSVREWVGTCTDVHERQMAEEALKEADRRKDEFLATLAHELRNPLAPIRNSLAILQLAGGLDAAAERVREIMERQVNHMVRLVDDLLEISRISRGKIELQRQRIELAMIVRSAVEASTPLIEAGRHQLAITLPPEPLTLDGDPVRLTQVIANLLNNAAKYTKQAGQIGLTARRQASDVVLSVRDNGVGISADMLPRVFEMFTQVDQSLGHGQGGLGIGLALVENLVRMHGGSVEAHSEGLGRGSEFIVRLPLVIEALAPLEHGPKRLEPATLAPRRILLVDDNRDIAESLAMLLKFLGADVHLANDGPSALESLSLFKPQVVLLDIGMPEMNGYEVAHRIRQQQEFRDVPLVALTGWGQEEDRRRTTEAGFQHHLVKPVALDTLQALLLSLEERGAELTKLQPSR